ncbi:OmpA family protein [Bdellovibrio reynosensis]|uniref:OmpA family protein n=1 Tax=Bdellovibrio reynosensis TaxID=2835041 RepID=A0ABY4CKZ7_9BACT|nr:OmpA family protein [Bdellovibrio reynosensis]UOF02920.1 OmpA family protein [Bdellovibrio reynosensis]
MKKILLISLLFIGAHSWANQETEGASTMEFTREEAARAPRGLLPFLTLGGGYTGGDVLSDVESSPVSFKLLGSYYLEHQVFDVGYGVNNQQFIKSEGTNLETATSGGVLELAARYKWDNRWQAGLVANHMFEQGRQLAAEQGDAQFVGLQALREFNITQAWLARVGARAMTLTNNTGDAVNMYLVDLQLGWNPQAYQTSVRQSAENPVQRDPQAAMDVEEEPTSVQMTDTGLRTKIEPARPVAVAQPEWALRDISMSNLVAGDAIMFEPSKTELAEEDEERLVQVAEALKENPDLVERIEVRGFADSSGDQETNQMLSRQRAEQVRTILQQNGLTEIDVVAVGRGSEEATGNLDQDRRAELIFMGVKDEKALRDALSTVE